MERWKRPPNKNHAKETTSHLIYVTGTPIGTIEEEEQNSKMSILSKLMSPWSQPVWSRMSYIDNNLEDSSDDSNGNNDATTASNDKRRFRKKLKRALSVWLSSIQQEAFPLICGMFGIQDKAFVIIVFFIKSSMLMKEINLPFSMK